jgi:hypothetical protein
MRPLDSQVVTQQSLSVPGQSVCQTVVIRVPEGWDMGENGTINVSHLHTEHMAF